MSGVLNPLLEFATAFVTPFVTIFAFFVKLDATFCTPVLMAFPVTGTKLFRR
jgi:hypothetical protein